MLQTRQNTHLLNNVAHKLNLYTSIKQLSSNFEDSNPIVVLSN